MIRYVKQDGVETITEICEHCGEIARTLHVSDIAKKSEKWTGEVKIKDSANADFILKTKKERIAEVTESFIRKGLLNEDEAFEQKEGLKYGIRAESMCSESINTETNVTQSFCYRTDNSKFLAKTIDGVSLSASFHASSEIIANNTGSKVGVDRNGNIIRLKSYKKINMETGIAEADANVKYEGPHKEFWWRGLNREDQEYLLTNSQNIEGYKNAYGKEVMDMSVVKRYLSRAAMIIDINNRGGGLT